MVFCRKGNNQALYLNIPIKPNISAVGNPHAKRLYDDLLNNYNRLIRPVSNNTEKLTVKLGLKLSQLIDVVSYLTIELYFSFIVKLPPPPHLHPTHTHWSLYPKRQNNPIRKNTKKIVRLI